MSLVPRRKARALGGASSALRFLRGADVGPPLDADALLRGYRAYPFLHAPVRRRAEALGSVEWTVHRPTRRGRSPRELDGLRAGWGRRHEAIVQHTRAGDLARVYDHPLLDLLDKPNPFMRRRAMLSIESKHLDLVGEAFLTKTRMGSRTTRLEPVVPTWVARVPTRKRPYFEVRPPGSLKPTQVDPEDMIWIRQHDPCDPYEGRGVGTGSAIADELEADEYMARTAKARFLNRASPDLLVGFYADGPGGGYSQKAVDKFMEEFEDKHRGVDNSGRVAGIASKFVAQQLGHTMVESQYVEGRTLARDFCLQVFGLPPEIFGITSASNRSTIEYAELLLALFSTIPMAELILEELQDLADEYPDVVLSYVPPIPTDRDAQKSIMVALPSAFTVDEVRAKAGHDPLPDGKGEVMMVAPGAPRVPVEVTPGKAEPARLEEKSDGVPHLLDEGSGVRPPVEDGVPDGAVALH